MVKTSVLNHAILVEPRVGRERHGLSLKEMLKQEVEKEVEQKDEDGWALMTLEALKLLSYKERRAIPINLNTVASDLNLFFFLKQINDYCEGLAYTTIMHTEKIEVFMHLEDFEVIYGDTWAEVRENIHCC
jgi:hypothetical protein